MKEKKKTGRWVGNGNKSVFVFSFYPSNEQKSQWIKQTKQTKKVF